MATITIDNEEEYEAALLVVAAYFENEPEPNTPHAERFSQLVSMIEAYEAIHFPNEAPDAAEAIKFRKDQAS